MPHIEILSQDARQVTLRDTEGNLVHLLQDDSPCSGGDVDKTDMFTGTFTGVLTAGEGVTAELLRAQGIPVYGESRVAELADPI